MTRRICPKFEMTESVRLLAPHALLPDGWAKDVRIEVDKSGVITALTTDGTGNGDALRLDGPVIPGMANLHSHAFQRAMAGLAERRGGDADSFWTWRETMYRFVSLLEPEDIEAIAAQLYVEMVEAGYTAVAEFHYLHHDRDGRPYAALTETSRRIVSAAETAGLRLTLLPVLYAQGGFGGRPLAPQQQRFGNDTERFQRLNAELRSLYAGEFHIRLGLALHSLRAVAPDDMRSAIAQLNENDARAPIHVHVAEQIREVEECIAYCGRRPVEWLFEQTSVDQRW